MPQDQIEKLATANQRLLETAGRLVALSQEMGHGDMRSRLSKEIHAILEASDVIANAVQAAIYVNA
ncbi:MAG TPA: hypothetical protein VHX39_31330 [Acetobacteraceae bacterium]|jgi:hypothetical protein|nr:hypothetical protein [Acetobacteraceae bacterium]